MVRARSQLLLHAAAWRAPPPAGARFRARWRLRWPGVCSSSRLPPARSAAVSARIHVEHARGLAGGGNHAGGIALPRADAHQRHANHAAQFQIGDAVLRPGLGRAQRDRNSWRADRAGVRARAGSPRAARADRCRAAGARRGGAPRASPDPLASRSSRKPRSAPVMASAASTTEASTSSSGERALQRARQVQHGAQLGQVAAHAGRAVAVSGRRHLLHQALQFGAIQREDELVGILRAEIDAVGIGAAPARVTRLPLTNVPWRLPQSSSAIVRRFPARCARACAKRGCRAESGDCPAAGRCGKAAARWRTRVRWPLGSIDHERGRLAAGADSAPRSRHSIAYGALARRRRGAPDLSPLRPAGRLGRYRLRGRSSFHLARPQRLAVRAVAAHFGARQQDLKSEMAFDLLPQALQRLAEKFFHFAAAQADDVRVLLFQAGFVVVLVAPISASGPAHPPARRPSAFSACGRP